jgi:hypothetical protein
MAADAPAGSASGRLGAAMIGTALAGLAVWITKRNLSLPIQDGWIFWVPIVLWLLTMSLLCGSVVVADRARRASVRSSWQAGWMVGGIGLLLGFVGPLVVTPTANLGPLLGILLTGPLGFVVGAIGAAVVRAARGSE